jgi:adenylate cyclase
MTMVAESRDVETGAHIIRTKKYVITLARSLYESGCYTKTLSPEIIDLIYRAAPLHDIGKVGIPDAILQKPGKLSQTELETMRSHVDIGKSVIENAINNYNKTNEFLSIALNITYSHHEKWDGSGYPLGLKGDSIPLEGRLMALADVYDALVSSRYYKNAFPFPEAERLIMQESGKHFDPKLVEAFGRCIDKFREIAEQNLCEPTLGPS